MKAVHLVASRDDWPHRDSTRHFIHFAHYGESFDDGRLSLRQYSEPKSRDPATIAAVAIPRPLQDNASRATMKRTNRFCAVFCISGWMVLAFLLSPLFAISSAGAEPDRKLYRAKIIVTGQREETRGPGIEKGLADVLVKATGDPAIVSAPGYAEIAKQAASLVASYTYRDRMEGIPLGDEQGTRDRPYDLSVDFDPAAITRIVSSLGGKVWKGPRPQIVVFLAVRNEGQTYVLTAEREQGRTQRESFADASWKFAMPVMLPESRLLQAAKIDYSEVAAGDPKSFTQLAHRSGGDVALTGTLIWSQKDLGWVAEWQLADQDKQYRWQIRGVNFDAAFRNAVSGTMAILSRDKKE